MTLNALTERNGYAAIFFGAAALLVTGLQPIILGSMVLDGFVSLTDAGLLAMAEVICIAAGAGVISLVLSLKHMRTIQVTALVGLIAANILSATAMEFPTLMGFRAASGLFSGVIVWAVTATLVRMSDPDRRAGIYLSASTLLQAALALICALFIVPDHGWRGVFVTMAFCSALPLFLTSFLATELRRLKTMESPIKSFGRRNIAVGGVVLFHLCAIGCIWAFLEPLGVEADVPPRMIELTVAVTLIAQVIGGLCGAWLSPKLPGKYALIPVAIVQLFIVLNMYTPILTGTLWFCGLAILFGGLWLFLLPFQFGLALSVDPSGRLATVLPALQLLGGAAGPLTVSLFIADTAGPAALSAAGFLMAALLLLLPVRPSRI